MSTDATRTAPPEADLTRTQGEPPTCTGELPNDESTVAPSDPVTPGAVDAPPGFAIEREIGVGGMGVVYLARQMGLNRPVALKLVKASDKVDVKALIRFLAEAEVVASIRHPNVVEVYSYGDHAGKPYMALEYCPGGDLTTLSKADQTRDAAWFRRVADLMAKVADGVNAAHAQGIVHRDLKPHNVFLAANGTPKVADFGLAKRGLGSDLTNTDAVMGTPAYMSPEQAGGGTKFVGPEADVWALGVMLYELACGARPIDTSGPMLDAIARVANGQVSQLRTRVPAVPSDLALIAHKCLSRDPRDRYPTAGGLATDLHNWLDGKPITARPVGVIEQAVKWAKRNKKLAGMGLAVLLTMATATGVSLGFGLEANKQAGVARNEKSNAEGTAERLKLEKQTSDAATERAGKEADRAQRMLAKALLATFSPSSSSGNLAEYQDKALWDLAVSRDDSLPLTLYAAATGDELATAQFRSRATHLDHAAVGLDSRRRRDADAILARGLRDVTLSAHARSDLAMAAVSAERFGATDGIAAGLLDELRKLAGDAGQRSWADPQLEAVVKGILSVRDRMPADRAADLCGQAADVMVEQLKRAAPSERPQLVALTASLCRSLPADKAAEVSRRIAGVLLPALTMTTDLTERGEAERVAVLEMLGALWDWLPADQAAVVIANAPDVLAWWVAGPMASDTHDGFVRELTAKYEWLPASEATGMTGKIADLLLVRIRIAKDPQAVGERLVALCERLPADRAAELCDRAADLLLTAQAKVDVFARGGFLRGLLVVCKRLSAERASTVLLAALTTAEYQRLTGDILSVLPAVCERLPKDKAAEVATQVTGVILKELATTAGAEGRGMLGRYLASVCKWLPPERAGVITAQATDLMLAGLTTTNLATALELANGLTAVCERSAADKAGEVSRKVTEALEQAVGKVTPETTPRGLAEGVSLLGQRLPAEKTAEVARKAAEVMLAKLKRAKGHDAGEFRAGGNSPYPDIDLCSVCEWLPADKAVEVMLAAVAANPHVGLSDTLTEGLSAACRRLPAETAVAMLSAALAKKPQPDARWELVGVLLSVAERLPPDKAVEVLRAEVANSADGFERGRWTGGLVSVGERLPADQATELLAPSAELLLSMDLTSYWRRSHKRMLVGPFVAAVQGLSVRSHFRHTSRTELAASTGVAVLSADGPPEPRPLPPQQLVELLKHPMCVREARRAVLDALEFTYDRRFADLWEFVAFAEKEHTELDLLTPPKRPAK